LNQERGNFIKAIIIRFKAGVKAYLRALKNEEDDSWIREW